MATSAAAAASSTSETDAAKAARWAAIKAAYNIRGATASDSEGLYKVCLQTGDSGKDGTHLFKDDPDALGRVFTQPYLELSPKFCFVLELVETGEVVGYTLGTDNTTAFFDKAHSEYLPRLCAKFPMPTGDKTAWTPAQHMHAEYHTLDTSTPASVAHYFPAHLHIDIVEKAQGVGNGKRLMAHQLETLRNSGTVGVHLGMSPRNVRAYRFYKKLGFIELFRKNDTLYLGLRFVQSVPPAVAPQCGVIEGFYGKPWSLPQRKDLFANMQAWGMSWFMYGPKDDKKLRAAWRVLYNDSELAGIKAQVDACAAHDIEFMFALSPGLDMCHSSEAEHNTLKAKLDQIADLGVRNFAILFDDISEELGSQDAQAFTSQAEAQCGVANAMFLHLRDRLVAGARSKEPYTFVLCPTEYCEAMAQPSLSESPYLATLGRELFHEATVFWTGPNIVSRTLTKAHLQAVRAVLQRKVLVWDNLHANDYDNGRRLYMGPYSGREAGIGEEVVGIMSNPNCEYEPNFIPLRTLSMFMQAEQSGTEYKPRDAYKAAAKEWLPAFAITNVGGTAATEGGAGVGGGSGGGAGAGAGAGGKEAPVEGAMTLEALLTLGDMYYLPWEHGDIAKEFLAQARLAVKSESKPEAAFLAACKALEEVYTRITELDNRSLCYALYRFAWDIKEEAQLLQGYTQWRQHMRDTKGKGPPLPHTTPDPSGKFRTHFCLPGTFRGGIMVDLQSILHMDASGAIAPPST